MASLNKNTRSRTTTVRAGSSSRSTRSNTKGNKILNSIRNMSKRAKLLSFVLVFAALGGGYFAFRSFANTAPFGKFIVQTPTALHRTGGDNNFVFATGNYDSDGRPDVFAIKRNGTSSTEVHILGSASGYRSFAMQTGTALHKTDGLWDFKVHDYDGDGRGDIYIIRRDAAGKTEVHILSSKTNYQSFALQVVTGLHATPSQDWQFIVGNYTGNGDLYAINRRGACGYTEVHVLSRSSNFANFAANECSKLHATDASWEFVAGDGNGDGKTDVYAIRKQAGNKTEVHALNAATRFSSYTMQVVTALHNTDANWSFAAGNYDADRISDVFAISRNGASSTEVHILGTYNAPVAAPAAPKTTPAPTPNPGQSAGAAKRTCNQREILRGLTSNCTMPQAVRPSVTPAEQCRMNGKHWYKNGTCIAAKQRCTIWGRHASGNFYEYSENGSIRYVTEETCKQRFNSLRNSKNMMCQRGGQKVYCNLSHADWYQSGNKVAG